MSSSPVRPPITLPSRDDGFVAGGAELLGGAPGAHAAIGRSWWTPLRVTLAILMLTLFAGWSYKAPCQGSSANWDKVHQFQYRHLCYTDIFPLYSAEGFDSGKVPYQDSTRTDDQNVKHYLEYPVGIGAIMQVASSATHALPAGAQGGVAFYNITTLILTLAIVAAFLLFVPLTGRRPWDAALFAAAPALALHAFTNWDLAAVAWAIAGLWAWSRSRPVLAGVFLGLGVATKFFPVFLLLALTIVAIRSGRAAWRAIGQAWGAALLVVTVTNLPVALAWRPGWLEFFRLNSKRDADWDSLWFQLLSSNQPRGVWKLLHDWSADTPLLNKITLVAYVVALIGIVWIVATAPVRPRVATIAFLVVASFLLINKVFSPQYTLWLLPLAVLARPRWGLFLVWQLSEVLVWAARLAHFYDLDHPGHGAPVSAFFVVVLIRDLLIVALGALMVRDVYRPAKDVVRREHDGLDPLAGPLADDVEPAASEPALAAV